MKTVDGHFEFTAPNGLDAACRLRVYQITPELNVVLASELANNEGPSVTNSFEVIATEACREYDLKPGTCIFVEHYDYRGAPHYVNPLGEETFDFVDLTWRADRAESPKWRHGTKEQVCNLIGEMLP